MSEPPARSRTGPSCAPRRGALGRPSPACARGRRRRSMRSPPAAGPRRPAAARRARPGGRQDGTTDVLRRHASCSSSPASSSLQTVLTWFARRASFVALRADVRRAARGLHAPRAGAAALDRRAGRDGRPRLAHDRRRRLARPHDPLRAPRDADRGGHDAAHGRRRVLGQPARRAPAASPACRRSGSARAGTCAARRPAISGSAPRTRRWPARSARRSTAAGRSRRSASARSGCDGSTATSRRPTAPSGARCYLRTVWFPSAEFAYVLPVAASLAWGGWLVSAGHASIGEVTAVALYVVSSSPTRSTASSRGSTRSRSARPRSRGSSASRRVPPDRSPTGDAARRATRCERRTCATPTSPGATSSTASTSTSSPGERVAVVGPVRRGQVDARPPARRHPPAADGRVEVGGVRLVDLPLDTLRQEVALVTQEQHVFVGTLAENLRLARPSASDDELDGALAAVDALEWAAGAARRPRDDRRRGRHPLTPAAGAAARARPARARRPAHARPRRGDLAARPAGRAPPRALARVRARRAGRSSRSPTACTPRTTPTASPSSRTACSASSARTRSWSRTAAPTPRSGSRGGRRRSGR